MRFRPTDQPKRKENGRIRRHDNALVIRVLHLCDDHYHSYKEVAKIVGLPRWTVVSWYRRRFLPKTGKYTFERMMHLVMIARRFYLVSKVDPMKCLKWATDREANMVWPQVRIYVYAQAMPTLPGFPLYADRIVNQKAELYGLGRRRYSAVCGVDPPRIPAEVEAVASDPKQTVRSTVPRQKGRKFVVEGQVSTLIPGRQFDLLG